MLSKEAVERALVAENKLIGVHNAVPDLDSLEAGGIRDHHSHVLRLRVHGSVSGSMIDRSGRDGKGTVVEIEDGDLDMAIGSAEAYLRSVSKPQG